MIARSHRFHGYGSLRGVYSRGQTVRAPLLSLKFSRRDSKHAYRSAVVVSKKVHKSAVVRNRIRRRIYEIIRLHENSLPAGLDLVFTVFGEELATLDSAKLDGLVVGLVRKALKPPAAATRSLVRPHGIVKTTGE